jgi:hypothetical protein
MHTALCVGLSAQLLRLGIFDFSNVFRISVLLRHRCPVAVMHTFSAFVVLGSGSMGRASISHHRMARRQPDHGWWSAQVASAAPHYIGLYGEVARFKRREFKI